MADPAAAQPVAEHAATAAPGLAVAHGHAQSDGGRGLLHQVVRMARGTNPDRLAKAIMDVGHENDPQLWTAIQQQLGNAVSGQIRAAMNRHVGATSIDAAGAAEGAERIPGAPAAAQRERDAEPAPAEAPAPTVTTTPASTAAAPAEVLTAPQSATFFGIRVLAAAGVHAAAIDHCAEFITDEIGNNDYAKKQMAKARVTIVIIPAGVAMTDVEQFKALKTIGNGKTLDGRDWSTVRGSGGMPTPDGNFSIAIAEENLVQIKGVLSGYPSTYSIGMHEFAHSVEEKGLSAEQRARIVELYNAHNKADPGDKNDTWTDSYAASNEREYFAQATNAFFGKNQMGANHNGREWLEKTDPNMYQFLLALYTVHHDADNKVAA